MLQNSTLYDLQISFRTSKWSSKTSVSIDGCFIVGLEFEIEMKVAMEETLFLPTNHFTNGFTAKKRRSKIDLMVQIFLT